MRSSFLGAIVLLVALPGCLVGCASSGQASATSIAVSVERCGRGWSSPHAGQQSFILRNNDLVAAEVFLVSAPDDKVVAYVDNVAPGATARLPVDLGSGRYAFNCAMSDRDVSHGPVVTVPGTVGRSGGKGATAVAAVTESDLVPITKAYQSWVVGALPALQTAVSTLATDVGTGDLARARSDWLTAHLDYLRLGGAYGAFGDLADAVDGTASGLTRGTDDPSFTGFHRIEFGLWHGQSAAALAPYAAKLSSDVDALAAQLSEARVEPLDVAIRAHEIAENALQFDLTGQTNYGSGSELASVGAELDGTSELVGLLSPILRSRYPELPEALRQLTTAKTDVSAFGSTGTWPSLAALPTSSRERVNSDVSELADLLAPIASICEPRSAR